MRYDKTKFIFPILLGILSSGCGSTQKQPSYAPTNEQLSKRVASLESQIFGLKDRIKSAESEALYSAKESKITRHEVNLFKTKTAKHIDDLMNHNAKLNVILNEFKCQMTNGCTPPQPAAQQTSARQ